jgi:hypothetical protein
MTAQLQQVALTYITRRSLWLMLAFGVVCCGPSVALSFIPEHSAGDHAPWAIFSVGFATGIVAWILLTQAKWQFCDQRSRLLPGFAVPHLAVIAAIAILGMGLYPWAVAAAGGISPLGFAACAIGIGSCYIWSAHNSNTIFIALTLAQYFSLILPQGFEFWKAERFALIHAAIFTAGWVAFASWLWRLRTMREEDADYLIPIQAQQGSATRMERSQSARTIARMMVRSAWQRLLADWWHDRLIRVHADNTAARKRLLRYGFAPTPIWINALLMSVTFFVILYFIAQLGFSRNPHPNIGSLMATLNIMILMPAMLPGVMLVMRRARMPQELLLPLRRREYLGGLFAAAALNAAVLWIPCHAAMLGLLALLAPASLTAPVVADLTLLSLGVQVYTFGVLVWIARKPSGGVRLVVSMAVLMPAIFALMLGGQFLPRPTMPPAELERQVQEEFTTTFRAAIPNLSREQQETMKSQIRDSYTHISGPSPNEPIVWVIAATLTAAGAAAIVQSRKLWFELELG